MKWQQIKLKCLLNSFAVHQEMSRTADFVRENRQTIKAKFANFQRKVWTKLSKNGVDTKDFRTFVANQFPPGDCIPPSPTSLTEVFDAITYHGLWDYFHYSPLVHITKTYGDNDAEMKDWVQTYKKDLKAFLVVTKVEDYIEADLDTTVEDQTEADLSNADPPPAKKAKHDPRYNCPVEVKLDTSLVDHSLQYLAEVWEMFSARYLLPDSPPTALLDRVREGCLSITWLVPTSLIPSLIRNVKTDTTFIQHHHILKMTVGDQCVYEEVTEESISVSAVQSHDRLS